MTSKFKNPSIYLNNKIDEQIATRGGNRSHVINRDMDRLYGLYARAINEFPLSLGEAQFLIDLLNGTIMDVNTARLLWAEAEDGIKLERLDEKWGIDGPAFVARLKELSTLHALALVDAAERFWATQTGTLDEELIREYFRIEG